MAELLLLKRGRFLNFTLTLIASLFLVTTGWGITDTTAVANPYAYSQAGYTNPTVTSDKDDYAPGETAIITGTGWTLDSTVDIHLEEEPAHDHHHGYHATVVDANGNWRIEYPIEERHLGVKFTVVVDGVQSKFQGLAYFTDGTLLFRVSGIPNGNQISLQGTYSVDKSSKFLVGFITDNTTDPPGQTGVVPNNGSNVDFSYPQTLTTSLGVIYSLVDITMSGDQSGTLSYTISENRAYSGVGASGERKVTIVTAAYILSTASTNLTASDVSSNYGGTTTLKATLKSGTTTLSGKTVNFSVNGTYVGSAITDVNGVANLTDVSIAGINASTTPYAGVIGASFTAETGYAASTATGSLTVNKAATETVVTIAVGPFTYTGSAIEPATVRVTGAGGLDLTPVATYSNNTNAGTATASYSYAETTNYLASEDSKTFTIGRADATIVVTGKNVTYDGASHGATGTATGVKGETLAGLNLGASFTNVPGGTASWTFTDATGNYNNANGSVAIAIGKAATETVVTIAEGPFTYTGSAITPATVRVTGAGGLDLTPVATYSNNTNAGTATASYSYTETTNYLASEDSKTFTIGRADATIVVTGKNVTYDGASHGATGTATGVKGETLAGLNLGASFTNVPGGTANWTFTDATGNYNNTNGSVEIAISKAATETVVTIAVGPFTYTGSAIEPATVRVTGAGGLDLTPVATYSNNTNAGTATASYSYTETANYLTSEDSKTFTIGKADATIVVTGKSVTYDGASHGATGTATGVKGEALAGLNLGASFTNVPGGTASWTFTDATGNYNNANGSVAIAIGKAATETVVTIAEGPFTYTGSAITPATVRVTGAGGLDLTPVATYSNNTNAGTATASYSYTETTNYLASEDSKTFTIGRADVTIVVTGKNVTYDGASHGATGTATGVKGETLAGLNLGASFTNVPGGTANWTFTDATGNYNNTNGSVEIAISKAATETVVTIAVGPFTYTGSAIEPATVRVTGAGGLDLTPVSTYFNNTNAGTATASYSYEETANYLASEDSETFAINTKAASVTPNSLSIFCGQTDKNLTGILTGFVGNDNITATYSRIPGATAGEYNISAVLSPANLLSNYAITYNTANYVITAVTIDASAISMTIPSDFDNKFYF